MDLIQGLIVLLVGGFLTYYIRAKGKNLATKEDVRNITDKIESIKSQYASRLHISQVRYEKEVEILFDLSEKLVEVRDAALALRPVVDYSDPNETEEERKKKRLTCLFEAMRDLYRVTEARRPFYPEEIYRTIKEFDHASWSEAVGYRHGRMNIDQKYWEKAEKNAGAISSLAEKAIGAIRDRIRVWERLDQGES